MKKSWLHASKWSRTTSTDERPFTRGTSDDNVSFSYCRNFCTWVVELLPFTLKSHHGTWRKSIRWLVLEWSPWPKRLIWCFCNSFASLRGFLLTRSFFTVALDTSSHFLKNIHGCWRAIEVDVARVGVFGAGVTPSSFAKAFLYSISSFKRLSWEVDRVSEESFSEGLLLFSAEFEEVDFFLWEDDIGGDDICHEIP